MSSMGMPDYYIPVGFRPVCRSRRVTGLLVELSANPTDTVDCGVLDGLRGLSVAQTGV